MHRQSLHIMEVANQMDVALLVLRVVVGLYLFGHGAQKLFGWFDGRGLTGTAGFLGGAGYRPARFWALNAGLAEAVGGALLFLGLLSPLGSIAIASAMVVAIATAHLGKGWFTMTGGPELPLTYIAAALLVAVAGPGRYALDSWLGIALPEPATAVVIGILALIGVAAALLSRRPRPAEQAQVAS
jgi:putative oxidoreductase